MARRILFLVPYPLRESPSQRFRFEQYFELLQRKGYEFDVQSFLNSRNWRMFFKPGRPLTKLLVLASGFAKRIIVLFKSLMYDFVFIHREVAPVGPPIFEWLLTKWLRRKIIYDFDDAIWLTDRLSEPWTFRISKCRSKVASICKWTHKVSCGNAYLCDYAKQFNKNVFYNPTTIDTENLHNPTLYKAIERPTNKVRIGWTGSHSTLKYLLEIESTLKHILLRYPLVEFIVIADKPPVFNEAVPVTFIPWKEATEIGDLLKFDIGIMPLPDDQWAKGKCGFKALQYMALQLPAIASPVGVNKTIIDHGINGFLCSTPDEWEEALRKLIEDSALRNVMGINGRKTVVERYSVVSNVANFLSLFE
jgi:glycosyltransferase involved in cell wall biosynthesis